MSFFRKKEPVVVQRKQRFSSFMQSWFGSRERCTSSDNLQKLLQGAADVNAKVTSHTTDAGYIPLHYAVREGNVEIVKTLLKNCGFTALHIAAKSGNGPLAEALLNQEASIYSEYTLRYRKIAVSIRSQKRQQSENADILGCCEFGREDN